MKKKVGLLLVVIAILAVLLSACGGGQSAGQSAGQPAGNSSGNGQSAGTSSGGGQSAGTSSGGEESCTVTFGAAVSLTGKYAKEGEYVSNGYNLYVEEINKQGGIQVGDKKCKVALKVYDDESKADRSAQLVEKLITEDKVQFLLGPYGSGNTYATTAIAEKYQVPMVEANGAATKIFNRGFKYSFAVLTPAPYYLRGIIDLALDQDPNIKTVAIIAENGAFALEVAGGAKDYAEEKGLEVVYFDKYAKDAKDLSSLLTAIKAKNPDILLGAGHLQDTLLIVKQAKDLNLSPKVFGFSVGPTSPEFRKALGSDADYIFGGAQWTPELKIQSDDVFGTPQHFTELYKAKYGEMPPYQAAESAAALIAYQKAIEAAGSLDRQAVRDALAKLDYMSFYGKLKFNEQGMNVYKPMAVMQNYPDGNLYTVWPKDAATKPPIYPFKPWDER